MTDAELMQIAIDEAWRGVRSGNGEVGVVVARDGELVYKGFNRMNTSNDVTGHAEIDALRAVSKGMDALDLSAYTLYCTLEPCGMCSCACAWARVGRIVFGAARSEVPGRYFELDGVSCASLLQSAKTPVTVTSGVLAERCRELYRREAA
jgi:tRNA(adenine34) deaminase